MHPRPTRHNTPESGPAGGWSARAACRGMDTELFFPSKGNVQQVQEAKAVCYGCPVREDCLEEALSFEGNKDFGILGGLDEVERSAIRRRRQRAAMRMARYANHTALDVY